MLAHAEIESYIENAVTITANAAYDKWESRRLVTEPIVSMLAYSEGILPKIPGEIDRKGPPDLQVRLQNSRNHLTHYVFEENHGIKEEHILRLLFPVGIREMNIDPTWLGTINSFGSSRGESAHRSSRVTSPPDPQGELSTVSQIIEGLEGIDEILLSFRMK